MTLPSCDRCGMEWPGPHEVGCGMERQEQLAREKARVADALKRASHRRYRFGDEAVSIATPEPPRDSAFEFWRVARSRLQQHTAILRKQVEEDEALARRIEDLLSLLAAAEGASK